MVEGNWKCRGFEGLGLVGEWGRQESREGVGDETGRDGNVSLFILFLNRLDVIYFFVFHFSMIYTNVKARELTFSVLVSIASTPLSLSLSVTRSLAYSLLSSSFLPGMKITAFADG